MTTYDSAVAAESEGKYHDALRLYQSILSNNDDTTSKKKQIQTDIQRVINILYGPKGSDETICVWKNSPLLSKTKPPPLQFRASCQVGNKIYVHGGCDFCENDCVPSSDDVWQYNTTLTIENGPSFQLVDRRLVHERGIPCSLGRGICTYGGGCKKRRIFAACSLVNFIVSSCRLGNNRAIIRIIIRMAHTTCGKLSRFVPKNLWGGKNMRVFSTRGNTTYMLGTIHTSKDRLWMTHGFSIFPIGNGVLWRMALLYDTVMGCGRRIISFMCWGDGQVWKLMGHSHSIIRFLKIQPLKSLFRLICSWEWRV